MPTLVSLSLCSTVSCYPSFPIGAPASPTTLLLPAHPVCVLIIYCAGNHLKSVPMDAPTPREGLGGALLLLWEGGRVERTVCRHVTTEDGKLTEDKS